VSLPKVPERTLTFIVLGFTVFLIVLCYSVFQLHADVPQRPAHTFNVKDYGAKGDSRVSTRGSMEYGSSILMCPDCSFTSNDVGKKVYVYGSSSAPDALSLGTVVRGVLSPTLATLAAPSGQSTSAALVQLVGTDDTEATLAARNAACIAATASNPSVLFFPAGGVYTLNGKVIEPCSNLRITGSGTILQININAGSAAGQGSPVIVFPGSSTGRFCTGGTMTAGSNILRYGSAGDTPCNFTRADVGTGVVVSYADRNYLPLYTEITKYVSKTQVMLGRPAQTAVPVTHSGLGRVGTLVEINGSPITNVEIDHLVLMNVSTAYPPGRTLGIGIVAFGADSSSFKRNVRVHNVTVMTASINCLGGNNGVLDEYEFQQNTLIGCADASMYVAGWNSRGNISRNTIQNVNFPGLAPNTMARMLQMGILVKNASNVIFADNIVNIDTGEAGMMFGDWPQFLNQVQNNTIRLTSPGNAVVGIGGNTGDHLLLRGNQIECRAAVGKGIWFYSNAVSNIEATGNVIRNCTAGIKFDGTGSGLGPANLKLKGNYIYGCGDGIRFENVGGRNVVENNKLSGCSGNGFPWFVVGSQTGSVTYFTMDNDTDTTHATTSAKFDNSVHRVPIGASVPR
jgi:hypothetical protein